MNERHERRYCFLVACFKLTPKGNKDTVESRNKISLKERIKILRTIKRILISIESNKIIRKRCAFESLQETVTLLHMRSVINVTV